MERRGHAEFDSFDRKVRQGGMIKPSVNLQELRRRIYRKAKAEKQWRFWGLYAHVSKMETLRAAYQEAKANDGTAGIDGESFGSIEGRGVEKFLSAIREELLSHSYKPSKNRRVEIPKGEWQDTPAWHTHHQGSSGPGSAKAHPGGDL
jgi:RNA-directed DNA polymerase